MSEWFGSWFDSEYYHLLYKDRNNAEAQDFIDKLADYLKPASDHVILDLACGKGRHSVHLNSLGAKVEGCDYSVNSINYAKKYENSTLHFFTHDMRKPLPKQYHIILNLFTSFGYFDSHAEHIQTLQNIHDGLEEGGTFVLDFMNVNQVINQLTTHETKTMEGIEFHIKREVLDGRIIKYIAFEAEERWHYHKEKVAVLDHKTLVNMVLECGFNIHETFGDYELKAFDIDHSPRLILILKK